MDPGSLPLISYPPKHNMILLWRVSNWSMTPPPLRTSSTMAIHSKWISLMTTTAQVSLLLLFVLIFNLLKQLLRYRWECVFCWHKIHFVYLFAFYLGIVTLSYLSTFWGFCQGNILATLFEHVLLKIFIFCPSTHNKCNKSAKKPQ